MKALIVVVVAALALLGCAGAKSSPSPQPAATALPTGAPATLAPTPPPAATPTAPPITGTPLPATTAGPFPPAGMVLGTVDSPRVVEMVTDDELTFFPNVVNVSQGETITFEITNNGDAVHEFMLGPVEAAFTDEAPDEVADIANGQTKSLTFTFDGPGPYAFACHEPGHFEAGMLGYVIVVGPDVPAVGTPANPRLVDVEMTDGLMFMPNQIDVTQGETVTFLLTNDGTVTHEFAIGPADNVDADEIDGVVAIEVDAIDGHHVKTLTYTFDGPGPYGFACHETGHFEVGMRGDIVLLAP